jgi:tetratricopeptide (TPR) repeat protein
MADSRGPSREPRTRVRYAVFLGFTLLVPLLLFAGLEAALRTFAPAPGFPLFIPAPFAPRTHLVANRDVGTRWFAGLDRPPRPMQEPFAAAPEPGVLRIIVLGESSAAGFPYPRNGSFPRHLREAIRMALPAGDSVEVVNLGIAATNSYAMWDLAREVAEKRPSAVLVYAGHNEYYGALGAGSAQQPFAARPAVIRAYLRALRLRTFWLLRNAFTAAAARGDSPSGEDVASLMELLARDQQIEHGGAVYSAGLEQFRSNLQLLAEALRARDIPVFIASVESNLADQPPFAAAANERAGGAGELFAAARSALAAGERERALALFTQARDLDVVRFRAPSALNAVVHDVVRVSGAHYVPAAESLAAGSAAGIPGADVFLEHVHPNQRGYSVIARAFFYELRASGILTRMPPGQADPDWLAVSQRLALTEFDERVALHTVRTITSRWPFVPAERQRDYRAEFRPQDMLDSIAFAVSRGELWERGKAALAGYYMSRGMHAAAAAEYRGLAADAPFFQEPRVLLAEALLGAGRIEDADTELHAALALGDSPRVFAVLGQAATQRGAPIEAVGWYTRALRLQPVSGELWYRLALVQAMSGNIAAARRSAERLRQLEPRNPAVPELLEALGVGR